MIAPVARCLSMMLEYSYLLREDEQLMHECHQQKLHLYNILRELHTYQAGHCCMGSSNNCFSGATIIYQVNGVGTRAWGMHGKFTGQLYQRLHKLAENWYDVVARKATEDAASVRELLSSALHFAPVVQWLILTVRLIAIATCNKNNVIEQQNITWDSE